MKILIIPDKFKGTLTAGAVADAIARGWRKARPNDVIEQLPMSDGGDGFGEVMGLLLGAEVQKVKTVDAAHRPCEASWWWEPMTKTAVIESANVIGIAMLPPGEFHPFELDTFGLGAVIRAAAAKDARRCIIGIGGSATNDGGFGMARALGWEFWDKDDAPIERWTELNRLARISSSNSTRYFDELIVAVDVQNHLLGIRGATRIYGPQKGLRPEDLKKAEECLRTLVAVECGATSRFWWRWQTLANEAGAGAAGGLGYGLMTFLGARPESGFSLFASVANLSGHLRKADLVITGEGRIDKSTTMGKGVGFIALECSGKNIPCIAFAGSIAAPNRAKLFTEAHALGDGTTIAKVDHALALERLVEKVAVAWDSK